MSYVICGPVVRFFLIFFNTLILNPFELIGFDIRSILNRLLFKQDKDLLKQTEKTKVIKNRMDQTKPDNYFESYEDLDVHKIMLEDGIRNRAYKQAILNNKVDFKDKIVLDVGAGTGILSIYCAQAGAKRVYAIEASNIFKIAEEIVKENNLINIIQVIHSKVENINLPEKVDIIVSEWMGFYLLHEGMLDSVITARDRFLKQDGLLFPESACLYAAPCSVPSMYDFWNNIDGISMKSLGAKIRENASKKPLTEIVNAETILSDPEIVVWFDLREVTCEDIKSMQMRHMAVATKSGKYQGICLWFTCTFPSKLTEPITLSTEPYEHPTHWKQTVIVLPSEMQIEVGSPMAYDISLTRSIENTRQYAIEVTMLDPDEVEHPEYCTCHMTKCILVRAMFKKYENNDMVVSDPH